MITLVTGATGGLGRNAIEYLLQHGLPVRATGRNAAQGEALRALGANFVPADLATLDAAQARSLLQGVDTVWHCAALSSPWGARADFHAANVNATERLADAAIAAGVARFVHVSTPSLYFDYQHHLDITESYRPRRYANHYAHTKALAEAAIRQRSGSQAATTFVMLRPRALFGPHDRVLMPRVLALMAQRRGKLPLPRAGEVLMDLTFTPNVVHAMQLASTSARVTSGHACNITNHEPRRLCQVLGQLLGDELGQPPQLRRLPYALADAVARGMETWSALSRREPAFTRYAMGVLHYDMTLDNTQAIAALGYRPAYTMDEGIRLTAQWMRDHGQHHHL
ncbi:NAD-dependent epimerase/dehydratase [Cupriavidus basilensis OR16]|uniref:NAD-dependent epimerase/dehydratase n=1 Tax=Cupriavidus basilensis OR16 TaxID=1127483 RepID=H1S9E0_9BURK|nr:NAD(P)-dependent oxidoreductase [Cupriavidus basilensis]EHP40864.1 NAD-dependent epimerase/dehydratase [Cupriavidus basilensis OR16]